MAINPFSRTLTPGNDVYVSVGFNFDIPLTIYALAGNDRVTVAGGWSTICYMGDGDDYVRVNGGTHVRIEGESGNDTVDMSSAISAVLFNGGDGDDQVNVYSGLYLSGDGGGGADRYDYYANINVNVSGGDGNDLFYGHQSIRGILNGGSGNDLFDSLGASAGSNLTLMGGPGDDLYILRDSSATLVESANEGVDQVRTTFSYTLGTNFEQLRLLGTANINGTGNALANDLVGNGGNNQLTGLGGNDNIYGKGGADVVSGGDGSDRLEGGTGRDEYNGGTGADSFVFRPGDFGGATTASADVIHDFKSAEGDRIGLNYVDANTALSGDQAFAFIGTAGFHGTAGELRYEQISGATYIEGDTNGDGSTDFMVRLDGLHTLASSNFVL